jgi:hypothetical protein
MPESYFCGDYRLHQPHIWGVDDRSCRGYKSVADLPNEEIKEKLDTKLTDEVRTVSSTGAEKGVKAARHDLIPVPALDLLARLYGKGADKYAAHNWRKGYEWSKSYAAAQRHMVLFWDGEDIDPEMGLPHVICAVFHMFALATYMIEHPEFDDRFKKEVETLGETITEAIDKNRVVGKVSETEEGIEVKFNEGLSIQELIQDKETFFTNLVRFDPPISFDQFVPELTTFEGDPIKTPTVEPENLLTRDFQDEIGKILWENATDSHFLCSWEALKELAARDDFSDHTKKYQEIIGQARAIIVSGIVR